MPSHNADQVLELSYTCHPNIRKTTKEKTVSPVSIERNGAVSVINIDNPPVNALSKAVRAGLMDCLEVATSDVETGAIVVACAGRTFIAGADIREFGKPPDPPYLPDVVSALEASDKPVVAAIHGTALGGGFEIALGCHYRIAAADASIGLPEVKLGLLPGATGTQRLPRLVGVDKALDMMLSGNPLRAGPALDVGAIDRVAARNDLRAAAVAYAEEMISAGPRRIRDMGVEAVEPGLFDLRRKKIAGKTRGLISPEKIIRAVELSTQVGYDEGCEAEREFFLECKESPQSSGLRHAFFAERAVSRVPGIGKDTSRREVNSVAVIGAGTMGAGIAYAALNAGLNLILTDNDETSLERGHKTIRGLYQAGVDRGKVSDAQMTEGLGRLKISQNYGDLADVDLVIEAAFENMAIKKEVFARLDSVCKEGVILATNTSTLDVDEIAAATKRPEDIIGLHFFSPAHIMRLLEIVRGEETSSEVIASSLALAKCLKKIGVVVGNCFGFVGNRMLYGYGRENQRLLLEGAAPEYIDRVLFDWGMAMGPNAVGDLAGLDVGYKVRQERTDLPDDPTFYRVADMLAEQGRYGQKTGKGMYLYEEGSRTPIPDPEVFEMIRAEAERLGIDQREISEEEIIERCIYGLIVEGARILEDGVASRPGDIDVIWINGYGFPRHRGGPMHFADAIGAEKIGEAISRFRKMPGLDYWDTPELLANMARNGEKFADSAGE
jgi:3-hydroxyacyl-CoA dehydrogenase